MTPHQHVLLWNEACRVALSVPRMSHPADVTGDNDQMHVARVVWMASEIYNNMIAARKEQPHD